jgi:hypothetical protein
MRTSMGMRMGMKENENEYGNENGYHGLKQRMEMKFARLSYSNFPCSIYTGTGSY